MQTDAHVEGAIAGQNLRASGIFAMNRALLHSFTMPPAELAMHDDALVENLNRRGVHVLTGGDLNAPNLSNAELAAGLVSSSDWRVRFAFVSWMLLRPADACVQDAYRLLTPDAADRLVTLFAVAAGLQARYRVTLAPLVKNWRPLSPLNVSAADQTLSTIAARCAQKWDSDVRWLDAFHQIAHSLTRIHA